MTCTNPYRDRTVRAWYSEIRSASENLLFEETLLARYRHGSVFLVWRNLPSVILGHSQLPEAEADLAFAALRGIPVIRRSTGGGAVYHDAGTVNYTFITDFRAEDPPALRSYGEPVRLALLGMGIPAVWSGRNDMTADGAKICGTAERIDRDRILSHGCILFSTDLAVMERILTPSPEKLARHHVASVRSRVRNCREYLPELSESEFARMLFDSVARSLGAAEPDEAFLEIAGRMSR